MRIQWFHPEAGYNQQVDTDNPALAAQWLTDLLDRYREILTNPGTAPVQLYIGPSAGYDTRFWSEPRLLDVAALQWLVAGFQRMDVNLPPEEPR